MGDKTRRGTRRDGEQDETKDSAKTGGEVMWCSTSTASTTSHLTSDPSSDVPSELLSDLLSELQHAGDPILTVDSSPGLRRTKCTPNPLIPTGRPVSASTRPCFRAFIHRARRARLRLDSSRLVEWGVRGYSPISLIQVSVLLANGLIGCFRSTNAASISSAERSGCGYGCGCGCGGECAGSVIGIAAVDSHEPSRYV